MKTFLTAALGAAAAMLSTVSAEAAKFNYRFTYEQVDPFTQQGVGDFYTVAGTLDADEVQPFIYEVTGATGKFSSNFNSDLGTVTGVGPGVLSGFGPGFVLLGNDLLAFTGTFTGDRFLSVDYLLGVGVGSGIESFGPITEASLTAAGVPEPATWALMILGMGAIGGAMRRRQTTKATIRFA